MCLAHNIFVQRLPTFSSMFIFVVVVVVVVDDGVVVDDDSVEAI